MEYSAHDSGAPAAPTLFSQLKDNSLKTSGYGYLVGDAALFAAGLMEKNPRGAIAGLLWGVGGLAAARYGNPDAEKQTELLTRRLGEYLKQHDIPIPDNPTTAVLTRQGGVVEHIEAFLYQYPSQTLNAIYALGATQLFSSGVKKSFKPDIASGILIGAGALSGLLIPEKKPDTNQPPQGMVQKALSWAQEKPLRVSGSFYTANNAAMLWAAFDKRKKDPTQKSYMLRFVTAASYIFANAMLSLSSKNNANANQDDISERLADISASVIAAQPKSVQQNLIRNVAAYLSTQPEIARNHDDITALLTARLAAIPSADRLNENASEKWRDKYSADIHKDESAYSSPFQNR